MFIEETKWALYSLLGGFIGGLLGLYTSQKITILTAFVFIIVFALFIMSLSSFLE